MNKTTAFLLIVIACLCFMLGTTVQSKAQNKTFTGVIPFSVGTDRAMFFDQNTGRIYIYDSNLNQCVYTGQISNLGEPIQPLNKSS